MSVVYIWYLSCIVLTSLYIGFNKSLVLLFKYICFLLILFIPLDGNFFVNIIFNKNNLNNIIIVYTLCVTIGGRYFLFNVLIGQLLLLVYTVIVSLNWGLFFIFFFKSFIFTHFLFYILLTSYFIKYLFSKPSSSKKDNTLEPSSSKKSNSLHQSSKLCYISVFGLLPRLEKSLKCLNSDPNVLSFNCSYKEFKEFQFFFRSMFSDSCYRVSKLSFFSYVSGNVVLNDIYRLKGNNFVDRDYFLRHYNSYIAVKFHINQVAKGCSYFCEGVCLDFSTSFWLGSLNRDGTFNNSFLSYCDMFRDNNISKINANIFIHDYNVLCSDCIFLDSTKLIYSDISAIKDLNSMDNKSVEDFISANSISLCLEFGLSGTDFVFLNYDCKTGLGYEKFLRNGGSF